MNTFRAYRAHGHGADAAARLETLTVDDLTAGSVLIRAHWSCINYKDALAATGLGRILKRIPLVLGIDVAGVVERSDDPRHKVGDAVLVVGCGLGESHDGGYSEYVRVDGDWVVPLPEGLSLRETMAIGTAGFTAALAIQRMEDNGLSPGQGPVLVNGASGGVGSLAVNMLAGRGYAVSAVSGKADAAAYLHALGATEVIARGDLDLGSRPLESALWAGAIDSLGGAHLAWLTRTVQPLGSVAAVGLAADHRLETTVMPFILRGINLLGINSTYTPPALRERVWARLATDLRPTALDRIVSAEVTLDTLQHAFAAYTRGAVTGRTLVRIGP